ncbi:serine threonine- kinase N2 isoform X1, partial [Pelobates cultripes]
GTRCQKSDNAEQKGEEPPECLKTPNSPKRANGSSASNRWSSVDLNTPKHHITSAINGGSSKDVPRHATQPDIDKIRVQIKQDIKKELKIAYGARNIGNITSNRKHQGKVNKFLKTSRKKLDELYKRLQERNAQIVLQDTEETSSDAPKCDTGSQTDNAKLTALKQQLEIELKVKHGAETMVQAYSNGHSK